MGNLPRYNSDNDQLEAWHNPQSSFVRLGSQILQLFTDASSTDYVVTSTSWTNMSDLQEVTPTTSTSKLMVQVTADILTRDESGDDADGQVALGAYNSSTVAYSNFYFGRAGLVSSFGSSSITRSYNVITVTRIFDQSIMNNGNWAFRIRGDRISGDSITLEYVTWTFTEIDGV